VHYGTNELHRPARATRWRSLIQQFTHLLALLLVAVTFLAGLTGSQVVDAAVVVVVVFNALFAFRPGAAGRARGRGAPFPPPVPPPPAPPAQAAVRRDGAVHPIRVTDVVPGDVVVLCEGDSIPADSRLLSGAVDVDMSMLTGESHPVARSTQTGSTPVRRTTRVEAAQVPDPVAGAGEQLRTQRHENGRVGDGRTRKVCNVDPAAGPGRELLGTLRVADWPYRRWSEMGKGERGSVGSACRCRLVAHGRERPRVRGIRGTRRPKSRQTRVRSDACRL
jgi:magnesium-transporting ATPase (P-type)